MPAVVTARAIYASVRRSSPWPPTAVGPTPLKEVETAMYLGARITRSVKSGVPVRSSFQNVYQEWRLC